MRNKIWNVIIIMLLFTVIAVVKNFFIVCSNSHYVVVLYTARDVFFFFFYSIKIGFYESWWLRAFFLYPSVKIFVSPSIEKRHLKHQVESSVESCKHNVKWFSIDYAYGHDCRGNDMSYDFDGHSNYYCLFHIA